MVSLGPASVRGVSRGPVSDSGLGEQTIMARSFGKRYLKAFVSGFFVAVPVTVTFLDRVAYIARVEGASMQPSLNPPGRTTCDVVLLNRWSVRNYEVQRGDVISLVYAEFPISGTILYIDAHEIIEAASSFMDVEFLMAQPDVIPKQLMNTLDELQ
ncbi:hypothetical protein chiPu_0005076 [Chiloscyllium punctatum]|uniref:Peptidase S26 domain-containing protein n=1 Tax=Chiloscyllium punctatum TaxID=137246 RepID=A0A401S8C9_CHIPU|nr:hypothetical protein [Chiloscyllium punctatum]